MFPCFQDSLWCLVCLSFGLYWWANILVLLFWCILFPGPTPYFNSVIGEWVEADKLIKSPFAAVAFLRCFLQLKVVFFFFLIVVGNPGLVPHYLISKKPWLAAGLVRDKRMPQWRFHWSSWVCPVFWDLSFIWTHQNGRELTSMRKNYVFRFVLGFGESFPKRWTACTGMAAGDLSLPLLNPLCTDVLATHPTVLEHPWHHKILAFRVKQQQIHLSLKTRLWWHRGSLAVLEDRIDSMGRQTRQLALSAALGQT